MEIIHLSAECYPVAKVGGLGDVVGALPKYQCKAGHYAKVVMPLYITPFLNKNEWTEDFTGRTNMGDRWFDYKIYKEKNNTLGFDLYLVDIHGLLDREKVYGYDDDTERFTSFQIAFLHWMSHWQHTPDIIHCHDHHTALIPFMLKYCYAFEKLSTIPTVFTIHNAQYQGWMGWDKSFYLPEWDIWKKGLLEWNSLLNPMASAIKNAWRVTTVSESYLQELMYQSNGLEHLFNMEKNKCVGILNGIDAEVWNPATDTYLDHHFKIKNAGKGKALIKEELCEEFHLDNSKPLFIFIGRLVAEKAANVLPDTFLSAMYLFPGRLNILILGSGDELVEQQLLKLSEHFKGNMHAEIGYKEKLSHKMYAGADFLLMPSRVEPCGLNQMYAMRYGTIPMVRNTGGLRDTVVDCGEENGWGFVFNYATVADINNAIGRALDLYENDPEKMKKIREKMLRFDHSWEHAIQQYMDVYESVIE